MLFCGAQKWHPWLGPKTSLSFSAKKLIYFGAATRTTRKTTGKNVFQLKNKELTQPRFLATHNLWVHVLAWPQPSTNVDSPSVTKTCNPVSSCPMMHNCSFRPTGRSAGAHQTISTTTDIINTNIMDRTKQHPPSPLPTPAASSHVLPGGIVARIRC